MSFQARYLAAALVMLAAAATARAEIVFTATLTEVYIARKFAEEKNISTFQNLRFYTRSAKKFIKQLDWTKVCVETKFFAHLQQTLLWTNFRCWIVIIFWVTYCSEKHSIRILHFFQ